MTNSPTKILELIVALVIGGVVFHVVTSKLGGDSLSATLSSAVTSSSPFTTALDNGETYRGAMISNVGIVIDYADYLPISGVVEVTLGLIICNQQSSQLEMFDDYFHLVDSAGNIYSTSENDFSSTGLNPGLRGAGFLSFKVPLTVARDQLKLRFKAASFGETVDLPLVVQKVSPPTAKPTPEQPALAQPTTAPGATPAPSASESANETPAEVPPSSGPSHASPEETGEQQQSDQNAQDSSSLVNEFSNQDARLNRVYQQLIAQLKPDDKAIRQLRDDERGWIRLRDAYCGDDQLCKTQRSRTRADELAGRLNVGMTTTTDATLAKDQGGGSAMATGYGDGIGSSTGFRPGVGGGLYRIGGGVSAPQAIFTPEADFSDEARAKKYQGVCLVSLIVDAQGDPQNPRVIRGLGMGLDEKALEAVRRYKFKPAMKDGRTPVPVMITIEVNFRLY